LHRPLHTLTHTYFFINMCKKTINEFVKEMKEQFGSDIEMKVIAPDGSVYRQTPGYLTDEQLAKSEKLLKSKCSGNGKEWKRNDYSKKQY
jgi:hypothetical protein